MNGFVNCNLSTTPTIRFSSLPLSRNIQAIAFFKQYIEQNCAKRLFISSTGIEEDFVTAIQARSSTSNSSGSSGKEIGGSGKLDSNSRRKGGPNNHLDSYAHAFKPREASSAGFEAPFTNLHWFGSLTSSICDSLFPTKTGKRLVEFLIINKTDRESVQNTDLFITVIVLILTLNLLGRPKLRQPILVLVWTQILKVQA